ncbi:hypothetical protein R6Q57_015615 [Mikania cordata]
MDQGYKHFSHLHNLIKHELPEGVDVSCSGCHASATGTIYVCWSCNFYLHDQCYQATRSMKHPSHPPHPLTLVPYPTYHSNSFYCNSCQVIGTGFSYSCADCEFDLHVQCAYSITQAASFKHSHQFQELVPSGWNGMHNSNIDYHVPFVSAPDQSPPIPFAGVQYHSTSYDLSYGSIPPAATQDPSMVHSVASVSIPMSSQNQIASSQYPSMGQIRPFSAPNPENQIPGVQESSMHPNRPSVSISTGTGYPQTEPSVSIPISYPLNIIPSSQDPLPGPPVSILTSSQDRVASTQYPYMAQTRPSVSIPTNCPPNPIPRAKDPPTSQTGPSDSIPTSSHNSSAQYPSMGQVGPVSIPTNYPQNPIHRAQDRPTPQTGTSDSIPTSSHNSSALYPSMGQLGPVSIPTNYPQNPIPRAQDPPTPQTGPSNSIPTSSDNSSAQYPSMGQTGPSVSIPTNYPQNPNPRAQDPPKPQTEPSDSIPTSSHNSSTQYPSTGPTNPSDSFTNSHDHPPPQNISKDTKLMHSSHPHNLSRVTLQEDEEDEVICSGCEETLVGNGYLCVEPDCNFHLHESCFHLKKEIHHKSHPEHPLTLLPRAPYNNKDGEFTCNACFSDGTGFTYHCSICKFDLHVQCVSLPETMKRDDHEHMLKLLYSCPVKHKEHMFTCDVCHGEVQKDRWAYYCESCDYGTHLGCVDCEVCERDSILDTQAQLQRLQLQMEMARQQAQFMASMGSSLANLVG